MTSPPAKSRSLGASAAGGPSTWVQTERAAHEAWARMTMRSPRAAAVMHTFVARMGPQNALVISQKLLAKLVGCNERTVRRAIEDLERDRWIQVVQIGPSGTMNAYVVNDHVAWGQKRDDRLRLSTFSAAIIADEADQNPLTLEGRQLRRIPVIFPPERALPAGPGEPGAQMLLDGMEPVIEGPPRQMDIEDYE